MAVVTLYFQWVNYKYNPLWANNFADYDYPMGALNSQTHFKIGDASSLMIITQAF